MTHSTAADTATMGACRAVGLGRAAIAQVIKNHVWVALRFTGIQAVRGLNQRE